MLAVTLVAACAAVPAGEAAAARSFGSRTLAQPMKGPDVRVLQTLLTRWGLRTPADGQFGPFTTRRVRTWEQLSARMVDGRMTRADGAALRAAVRSGQRRPDAEPRAAAVPVAAGDTATIGPDGLAVAPASAPPEVQAIIAAGNEIHDKPYKYGGGHGRWIDSGYDCSGSMSYALHGAGLLATALNSSGFMRWGEAGPGEWVTTYANAGHSFMVVAGLRFDTSGRAADNSRWDTTMRSAVGYTVRHPPGL